MFDYDTWLSTPSEPQINVWDIDEDAIHSVIERTGKNDGSITRWFCEHLGVAKIEDITMEQIAIADELINKMERKQ